MHQFVRWSKDIPHHKRTSANPRVGVQTGLLTNSPLFDEDEEVYEVTSEGKVPNGTITVTLLKGTDLDAFLGKYQDLKFVKMSSGSAILAPVDWQDIGYQIIKLEKDSQVSSVSRTYLP
jgi:hypothetical protein